MEKYFGVKTFIVTRSTGKPNLRDPFFQPNIEMLEERVLLVKAKSFEVAIKMAEKETKVYCRRSFVSVYGQKVSLVPLKYVDSFEINEDFPGLKDSRKKIVEVFSTTEIIEKKESLKAIIDRKAGRLRKNEKELRFKFLEKEISVKSGKVNG